MDELLTRSQAITIYNFLRIQGHANYEKIKKLQKDKATSLISEFVQGMSNERKVELSKKYGIHHDEEPVSNCCGAPITYTGLCQACKDHT